MRIVLYVMILISLTSCYSRKYYIPNTANAPYLSKEGEIKLNGGLLTGFESGVVGGEVQVAYALKDRIGVHGEFFHAATKSRRSSGSIESDNANYGELGIGYFNRVGKSERWRFEIYGGGGLGSMHSLHSEQNSSRVSFSKYYLQPSIGYKMQGIEFAFVPKLSRVHWELRSVTGSFGQTTADDFIYIRDNENFFCIESTALIRMGGEKLKVQLAMTLSDIGREYGISPREPVAFYFGTSFTFFRKEAKRKIDKDVIN